MKLNLFLLGQKNEELFNELPAFFDNWHAEIASAEPIFSIEGERLEKLARDIPHNQFYYAQKAQDARALVKWLEIHRAQKEARYLKNYNNSPRALGVKEQAVYLAGEKDIVEVNQLIVEAQLCQNQLEEIVDAIKQLAWQLGNVVKLRIADLGEGVL